MRRPLTRKARARRREALRAALALLGILAISTAASLRQRATPPPPPQKHGACQPAAPDKRGCAIDPNAAARPR